MAVVAVTPTVAAVATLAAVGVAAASMPWWVQALGYTASALVVASLVMSSLLRLRLIGLAGAVVFGSYAVLIGSVPVLVTNLAILGVHTFHLRRLLADRARSAYFEVVPWRITGAYVPRFLRFWADDIRRFQPDFAGLRGDHTALVVLRDVVPVGLVLFRTLDGTARIDLDYVVPAHRDFRAASSVFAPDGPFPRRGIERMEATAATELHRRYLERIGFVRRGRLWTLHLDDRAAAETV